MNRSLHCNLSNGLDLIVLTNIKSRALEHNQDFFVVKQILALNAYMVGGGGGGKIVSSNKKESGTNLMLPSIIFFADFFFFFWGEGRLFKHFLII